MVINIYQVSSLYICKTEPRVNSVPSFFTSFWRYERMHSVLEKITFHMTYIIYMQFKDALKLKLSEV